MHVCLCMYMHKFVAVCWLVVALLSRCRHRLAAAKLLPTSDVALSRCRHRLAAAKLPMTSRCCAVALSRCRAAAAATAAAAAAAPPFVGWLLLCCPSSDFVVITKLTFPVVPHRNPNTRAQ